MKPESVDLDQLHPDPNNARSHEKGIPELKKSLETFGQIKPVVVWGENLVIAGNGTLEAARQIGWPSLFVVRVPEDWDYDQARAFALADNKTAELSEWNLPQLETTRWELEANGWDTDQFGFEQLREPPTPLLAKPDDVPPMPAIPTTKLGDVIELGRHRIICASATSIETYETLMGTERAQAIWTDPPYNVNYVGKTEDELMITGDNQSDVAFEDFLRRFFRFSLAFTKPGGAIYVCHSDKEGGVFRRTMIEEGWLLKQCLIWVKNHFVFSRQDYHSQHEPILYGWKPGAAHTWLGTRMRSTLLDDEVDLAKLKKEELVEILAELRVGSDSIREDRPARSVDHPTMKPVKLITRTLENNVGHDDLVLDPFAGSGSTMVACEMLGATARLIEIDPKYVDVVIARYENLTGEKAVVSSQGGTP